MADAFDKYRRKFTDAEKAAFTTACRDHGVDPKTTCPFCRASGRRIKTEPRYRYCEEHKNWEGGASIGVACHNCKVQWGVLLPGGDACRTMDGEFVDG